MDTRIVGLLKSMVFSELDHWCNGFWNPKALRYTVWEGPTERSAILMATFQVDETYPYLQPDGQCVFLNWKMVSKSSPWKDAWKSPFPSIHSKNWFKFWSSRYIPKTMATNLPSKTQQRTLRLPWKSSKKLERYGLQGGVVICQQTLELRLAAWYALVVCLHGWSLPHPLWYREPAPQQKFRPY